MSATYPTVLVEHYHSAQIQTQTSTIVEAVEARVLVACTMRVKGPTVFARTQCAMARVWIQLQTITTADAAQTSASLVCTVVGSSFTVSRASVCQSPRVLSSDE